MSYLVMARKYRPKSFKDVVGQPHVVHTLENALRKGRFAHAYIFSGPRGIGKTTTARILARALNCVDGPTPEPCGECDACRQIIDGVSLDVLEIDAASNRGIDEIRNLRDNVRFTPAGGKFRVYIIDEIHMLTTHAFNAFLKTLEEPPAHVVFIGATTEIEQVPRTVLSRMQRFNFRLVSRGEIGGHLQSLAEREKIPVKEEAIDILAARANGSLRDGIGLLDQLAAYCDGEITAAEVRSALGVIDVDLYFRTMSAVSGNDTADIFKLVDDLAQSGIEPAEFMRGFSAHYRDLLLVKSAGEADVLEGVDSYRERMAQEAGKFSELDLVRLMKIAFEASMELKRSQTPIMNLELRLLTMQKLHDAPDISELLKELKLGLKSTPVSDAADLRTTKPETGQKPLNMFDKTEKSNAVSVETPSPVINDGESSSEKSSESTPQVQSSPVKNPPDLQVIKNAWEKIRKIVSKEKMLLNEPLRTATLASLKGRTLEIIIYNGLISPDNIKLIANIIKQVTGMEVRIKFVKKKKVDGINNAPPSDRKLDSLNKLMEREPLIKEIVNELELEPM